MTPGVALLVAVGEILGTCAIGMGVYGLCRLRLQRRRDVRVAEQTCGYGWHVPGCADDVYDQALDADDWHAWEREVAS